MTRTAALFILALSLLSVSASQVILKARVVALTEAWRAGQPMLTFAVKALSDPVLWLGGGFVLLGAVCWYVSLSKLPLNLMLPLASVMAPASSIGAYIFLGESLSLSKMAAILLITFGVAWLGWLNA